MYIEVKMELTSNQNILCFDFIVLKRKTVPLSLSLLSEVMGKKELNIR